MANGILGQVGIATMANIAKRPVQRVSGRAAASTVWAARGSCVAKVLRWSSTGGGFIGSSQTDYLLLGVLLYH